ncbi:MAG: hypothetical protein AAFU64_19340, partial [Bacteroidota bacterium]
WLAMIASHQKNWEAYKAQINHQDVLFRQKEIIIRTLKVKCIDQMIEKITPKDPQDLTWPRDYYERLLDQAFLWDEMTYTLLESSELSSFGVHHPEWPDSNQDYNENPEFNKFLSAKAARVNIAARLDYDWRVFYLLFVDDDLPQKPYSTVLPASIESYAKEMIPGKKYPWQGKPVGEAWEVIIPTDMVKLQLDNQLPTFNPKYSS